MRRLRRQALGELDEERFHDLDGDGQHQPLTQAQETRTQTSATAADLPIRPRRRAPQPEPDSTTVISTARYPAQPPRRIPARPQEEPEQEQETKSEPEPATEDPPASAHSGFAAASAAAQTRLAQASGTRSAAHHAPVGAAVLVSAGVHTRYRAAGAIWLYRTWSGVYRRKRDTRAACPLQWTVSRGRSRGRWGHDAAIPGGLEPSEPLTKERGLSDTGGAALS